MCVYIYRVNQVMSASDSRTCEGCETKEVCGANNRTN